MPLPKLIRKPTTENADLWIKAYRDYANDPYFKDSYDHMYNVWLSSKIHAVPFDLKEEMDRCVVEYYNLFLRWPEEED